MEGAVSRSASAELQSRQAKAAKPETVKTESREPSQSSRVVAAKSGFPTAVNPAGMKAPEFLSATEEAHSSDSMSKKNPSSEQGGTPKRAKQTLPATSAKGSGKAKPAKGVFLNMSLYDDDPTKVVVGAKGYKSVKVPMASSIQEVLALVFQQTGLQAYYQTAFKVQTQIEGQATLESCADKPTIFVLISTDSD